MSAAAAPKDDRPAISNHRATERLLPFHHTTLQAFHPPDSFPQRYPSNSMLIPSSH
jgi:hypothetical protein